MTADAVLRFWFEEHGPEDWFAGGAAFDAECAERFGETHERAARAELWHWRGTLEGRLAEIILLDQFSRQLHRNSPRAFASDLMAVALAQEVVASGGDQELTEDQRAFLYLPFEHAESLVLQDESVRLFSDLGQPDYLDYAIGHRDVIARFGRFPMRNAALGRTSTPEELDYIASRNDGEVF